MDDVEVLTATLNNTIQRQSRVTQNYEIEIANLTAEVIRLRSELESLTGQLNETQTSSKEKKVNAGA